MHSQGTSIPCRQQQRLQLAELSWEERAFCSGAAARHRQTWLCSSRAERVLGRITPWQGENGVLNTDIHPANDDRHQVELARTVHQKLQS